MVYTPYTSSGQCKEASDVMSDISVIAAKGFTTIRMYSTDCSGLQNVGAACKAAGIKMIIGVYIEASGCSAAQPQVSEIAQWAQWEIVELIVIGNEACFNGWATASELAAFVTSSKEAFTTAGYTGPCTIAEPVDTWQANADTFCPVVDAVGFQGHPFFNSATSASEAGAFVESQFAIINALCPGKSTSYNLECGWPSAGDCNGAACPGKDEQATAIASIKAAAGGQTCILGYADDTWKDPGAFNVEQYWGAIDCY